MKRHLLILFAFLLTAFNAFADGIAIDNITLNNEVANALDVKLNNTSADIVGLQFNLTLPEGVTPVMDGDRVAITPSARLKGSYALRGSKVSDGSCLFTFLSNDRTAIEGNEGSLFSISLQNTSASDGNYSATISGVTLTDKDGNEQTLADAAFSITIEHKYTLTYKVDGADYKSVAYTVGDVISAEAEPAKEGYTFSGWSEVPGTMPANDVTVTGAFTINQYTITFDTDGGSAIAPITLDYGAAITVPDSPTKEGYTFAGWNMSLPATMPSNNITVVAMWTINSYKLIYKVDGEEYKSITYKYGEAITPETEPIKVGYTFSGWSEIPGTMPANDVDVTGTFTINQYKVTFISDGVVISETTQDFGSAITKPKDPAKEGYTFTGWDSEVAATVPANDVTYTAQFTINQYTVTFDTDGGSAIAPITQDYGTAITEPSNPEKTGYSFAGWDKEIPSTMPAENITVKALWTINSYNLVYVVDGIEYKSVSYIYGAEITPEAEPYKEGYMFSGWTAIPSTMPANDVTITGSFTKGSFKVTYYVDGAKYKAFAYDFGDDITPESEPTKDGYTFSGWSEIPGTMPADDVTVTGTFTINQYKVTFISDGEVIFENTQDFGSAITKPADPAKEGYTFTGWDSEVATAVPSHDVTYTAQFSVNYYKVLYYVDDKLVHSESVAYGEPFTLWDYVPTDPSQIFNGWDGTIYDTMPAHDIIYSAIVTADGIESITASGLPDGAKVYTLSGKQVNTMHSGFYIVRMPDGTTKKLYLK